MVVTQVKINMLNKINKRLNSMNFFSKLITCFIVTIVLPLIIVYLFSYNTIKNIMVYSTYNDTLRSLDQISRDLTSVFNNMVSACIYVNNDYNIKEILTDKYDDPSISESSKKLNELQNYQYLNSIFSNIINTNFSNKIYITLLDSNGIRFSNWEQNITHENEYFNQYLKDFNLSSYKIEWKDIQKNYVTPEKKSYPYVITVKKDLIDTNNYKKYGVFIASIPEKELRRIMTGNSNKIKRLVIFDDTIVSAYDDKLVGKSINQMFDFNIPSSNNGYFVNKNKSGQKDLIMYDKILNTNYYLVEIKSYDMFVGPIKEQGNRLLLIYFICMLVFANAAWIISKGISTPLKELAAEMKNFDIENQYDVSYIKRKDEIGILQNSFSNMKIDIKNLIDESIEKERKKRSAELEMLQAQISPHFLFNTLNSIRWAAINNHNEKAANMALSLVKLLRMTINKDGELISIENEIDNVSSYISILQMRHSTDIKLKFSIDEELKKYNIPRLLLQPIIENSVIHGVSDEINEIVIEINVYKEDEQCIISIKDNGKGFDTGKINSEKTKSVKFSGIGLNNINDRIKLYFGEDYGLKVQSEINKGTTVIINLPLG